MTSESFMIDAVSARTCFWVFVIVLAPMAVVAVVIHVMSEGSLRTVVWGLVALALLLGGGAVWQMHVTGLRVEADQLIVGGGAYTLQIPANEIEAQSARRLLPEEIGDYLRIRTNGIGMPGFSLGWHSGKEGKVFAVLAHSDKAVVVPTRKGYSLVVSPSDPEAFLQALVAH